MKALNGSGQVVSAFMHPAVSQKNICCMMKYAEMTLLLAHTACNEELFVHPGNQCQLGYDMLFIWVGF